MIGFGSYGNNGGPYSSPPSSNLSASAPPFTIDRSPNTGYMPLVDLLEQSSRTGTLNNSSSLHNWLPPRSPTSETNFFSDPNLELNSVASPNNPYNYASLNTHLPHLSTSVSASADAFSYAQCGDGVAKPYYFSFLSPPTQKDGSLVVPDQTSYDWLSSSSHVAVTALDGSSNKDYTQRSGDSKKPAQWDGLWNGFSEWEQGNQGLFDGSFCCSKESDIPVSSVYENFTNQGNCAVIFIVVCSLLIMFFDSTYSSADLLLTCYVVTSPQQKVLETRSIKNKIILGNSWSMLNCF